MLFFFTFLEILTTSLPTAVVHRPYSADPVTVLGGGRCTQNSVSMRVATGALPEGLGLTPAGYFKGIPRQAGLFTFQIRAENECQVVVKTFTLRVEGAPLLVAAPEELEFHYTPGGTPPPPQVVRVSSSWEDMAYSIEAEGATWLMLRPLRGRTPFSGSGLTGDPVVVSVVPGKLAPGSYRAFLKVSAWETTNEPRIPVTLVISPAAQPKYSNRLRRGLLARAEKAASNAVPDCVSSVTASARSASCMLETCCFQLTSSLLAVPVASATRFCTRPYPASRWLR